MYLTLMSEKFPADVAAVTTLPDEYTWCGRRGDHTTLRISSWSFRPEECISVPRPCSNYERCQRVACAFNRPGH